TTDASDLAIGAVLSQNQGKGEQPIAYESRKPYLESQKFTVITDHASLEYIHSQSNLSQRQARWLEVLQSTPFEVKYRPGKTNVVADALSRKPYLSVISVISTTLIENDKLAKSYQEDKHFTPIWDILHNPNATVKQKAQVKNYELVGNKIYLHEGKQLPFTVTTDASDIAIGAVLSQNQGKGEQPIAYESRKLTSAEKNYPVHEKELLAIVHAIKIWRPYLESQKFTVITDHASLEYIHSQSNLSRQQARWLEVLQSTPFEVKYQDKHFAPIWDILHNPNATVKQKAQVKNYELVGNKIYLHEGKRLVVP
ncbi:3557_t:CDS:2, partial [Entrophospora sp. SA101]